MKSAFPKKQENFLSNGMAEKISFRRVTGTKERSPPFCVKDGEIQNRWSFYVPARHASERKLSAISLDKITLCSEEQLTSFFGVFGINVEGE